jgi:hypothetical protein
VAGIRCRHHHQTIMQSQIFLGINAELDETGVLSAMCIGLFLSFRTKCVLDLDW